ncbi:MAG: hypothetical protein ACRYG7_46265 [Janthinobacterium lividum]
MSLKNLDQLTTEINAAVHPNGPQGKTTASSLRAVLQTLATELTTLPQEAALRAFTSVPTLADLFAIPTDAAEGLNPDGTSSGRRQVGMVVFVVETNTRYELAIPAYAILATNADKLAALSDNANWVVFAAGSTASGGFEPQTLYATPGTPQDLERGKFYYRDGTLYRCDSTDTISDIATANLTKIAGITVDKLVVGTVNFRDGDVFFCAEDGNLYEAIGTGSATYDPANFSGIAQLVSSNIFKPYAGVATVDYVRAQIAKIPTGGEAGDTTNLAKLNEANAFTASQTITNAATGLKVATDGTELTLADSTYANYLNLNFNDLYFSAPDFQASIGVEDRTVDGVDMKVLRAGANTHFFVDTPQTGHAAANKDYVDNAVAAYLDAHAGGGAVAGASVFDFKDEIQLTSGPDDSIDLTYERGRSYALNKRVNPDDPYDNAYQGTFYGVDLDYGNDFRDGDVLCFRNNFDGFGGNDYRICSRHSGGDGDGFNYPGGSALVLKCGEAAIIKFCFPAGSEIESAYWTVVSSDKKPVVPTPPDLSIFQEKTGYYSPILNHADPLTNAPTQTESTVYLDVYKGLFFKPNDRFRLQSTSGIQDGLIVGYTSSQGQVRLAFDNTFTNFQGPFTISFAPPGNDTYLVQAFVKRDVANGTFTAGELQGTQPTGSHAGMKFVTAAYGYEFMPGANGAYVWCRFAKG